jgi:hypothetical protein
MRVHVVAKIGTFEEFLAEYRPGDEIEPEPPSTLLLSGLANTNAEARFAIAGFLLDRGVTAAGLNEEGDGALTIALAARNQDVAATTALVRRLIAAGADPAARNRRGVTPTQVVAQLPGDDAEWAPLLDFWFTLPGLEPAAPNAFGKSPIDLIAAFPTRADRVARMRAYVEEHG